MKNGIEWEKGRGEGHWSEGVVAIQLRRTDGQDQADSNGGGEEWSDSGLYSERQLARFDNSIGWGSWEVGNREESKITAKFGLRLGSPQKELIWGKEQGFAFGHVRFQV